MGAKSSCVFVFYRFEVGFFFMEGSNDPLSGRGKERGGIGRRNGLMKVEGQL